MTTRHRLDILLEVNLEVLTLAQPVGLAVHGGLSLAGELGVVPSHLVRCLTVMCVDDVAVDAAVLVDNLEVAGELERGGPGAPL